MKIEQIELVEVVVPARPGSIESEGMHHPLHMLNQGARAGWSLQFDEMPKWVLIATCDDGTTGLGETYRGVRAETLEEMAWVIVGRDVGSLRWSALPLAPSREYDGFESLVYDLAGKLTGLPLHQLLGGSHRDEVLVSAWSSHRTPDDAGAVARDALDQGVTHIKFKCSLDDDVVAWAEAIADSCGDRMRIILDPNGRFHEVRHATEIAKRLERVGNVVCLEDPVPRWDLEGFAELRRRTTIPIALHLAMGYAELGNRREDAYRALHLRAVDMFNFTASISDFMRLASMADLVGVPYWHGSEVDLGILEAVYVHLAAVAPGCILPSDIFGRRIREHDLLANPLELVGERVRLPTGPGLGVELDHAAVDRFATRRIMVTADG
ncbi:MAG: mandelate racemase [Actinobacteria bacterium]|nr:mandelate racemase [Actinomycetota bacterium]